MSVNCSVATFQHYNAVNPPSWWPLIAAVNKPCPPFSLKYSRFFLYFRYLKTYCQTKTCSKFEEKKISRLSFQFLTRVSSIVSWFYDKSDNTSFRRGFWTRDFNQERNMIGHLYVASIDLGQIFQVTARLQSDIACMWHLYGTAVWVNWIFHNSHIDQKVSYYFILMNRLSVAWKLTDFQIWYEQYQ